jgi:hypothetical protein
MFSLGLDYSKRFSVATVVDGRGRIVRKGKLANRREAGRNYYVAAELLEGLVKEIKLAHPLKVRAI